MKTSVHGECVDYRMWCTYTCVRDPWNWVTFPSQFILDDHPFKSALSFSESARDSNSKVNLIVFDYHFCLCKALEYCWRSGWSRWVVAISHLCEICDLDQGKRPGWKKINRIWIFRSAHFIQVSHFTPKNVRFWSWPLRTLVYFSIHIHCRLFE